ncbi:MAG TPA: hypothetical protein VGP68_01745 [Gemmataceae bacterium]|jgi:hypothetical protein|nr:hypothetical protein [Gemmataceae bacterium]
MKSHNTIQVINRKTLALTAVIVTSVLLLGAKLGEPGRKSGGVGAGQEPIADPLPALNDAFREAYARCRQKFIDRSGAVILVESDNLVLLINGQRSEVRVVPELFHILKAVSHIPLAVYVMLVQVEDAPLDKECLDALCAYRDRAVQAEPSFKDRGLTEKLLLRQQEIIHAAVAFLDLALTKKQVSHDELTKFTRGLGPKLLANAADSAQAELDGIDKQVNAWRATLSEEEWKKLHIVVMGSALPRQGNLAVQYFAHLLGEKGEGKRIVYAEALFEEKRALNLLGTNLLDTRIGTDFFNDDTRMHRDLLADAAAEYVMKLPARP